MVSSDGMEGGGGILAKKNSSWVTKKSSVPSHDGVCSYLPILMTSTPAGIM